MPASPLFAASPRHQALAFTVLRVITGATFAAHGYQKLFIFGVAGVQGAFTMMGAPMPMVTGPLVGCLELFGGIAVILGLLTRLVAAGLAIDMLGAIVLVHFANGFFLPKGYELVLALFAASLALAVGGAGRFSVDDVIAQRAWR